MRGAIDHLALLSAKASGCTSGPPPNDATLDLIWSDHGRTPPPSPPKNTHNTTPQTNKQSQRLKTPLSTVGRLLASEYALYVLADEQGRALGFIKLGRKCLYVTVRTRARFDIRGGPLIIRPYHHPTPSVPTEKHPPTHTNRTRAG